MEIPDVYGCKFCNRHNFTSLRALEQHQATGFCAVLKRNQNQEEASAASYGSYRSAPQRHALSGHEDNDVMPFDSPPSPPEKAPVRRVEFHNIANQDLDAVAEQIDQFWDDVSVNESQSSGDSGRYNYILPQDDSEDNNLVPNDLNSDQDISDAGATDTENSGPNTWIRSQWLEYCAYARQNFLPLSKDEIKSIRLLHLLKSKDAPINTYDALMAWHLRESGQLREHEPLSVCPSHIGRTSMLKKLAKRYNYENKYPYQKAIKLPVSGTRVKITVHDTAATIQKLLTDPRIRPKDYMFWDDNPLAGPPENMDYVQDLNTGKAFVDTWHVLIDNTQEQLFAVPFYCDGTAVSHFHDMEIIQVKIALGIMSREARMKGHCWATLGYIEKIHEHGGRGRDMLNEANHLDTQDGMNSDDSAGSYFVTLGVGDKNDQDFHAMLGLVLQGYVQLQESGFMWDQVNSKGEVTHDIHYKLFVPFVRADTKEADLFCGKYGNRSNTQQLCRKCHIPLQEADNHLANYRKKTEDEISKLVDAADYEGLQRISQTYLVNAWHGIRFSMGNSYGIHGSCPSELLHAFLLGTFKYTRDIFFELLGKDSEASRLFNALSKIYGRYFARQSDRTMPFTAFSKGIQVGKLMAKDYRGVLLIMLAMVASEKGQKILRKKGNFKLQSDRDDWILLLEFMLEWESYLNEPIMYKAHVKRLEKKHRFIFYIMRRVARRQTGMGLKLMKVHAILHICEDIIDFGVPLEFDTSANEQHHKASKRAARRTQRAAETFNFQTATRLFEWELLDLAMEEIENKRVPWEVYQSNDDLDSEEERDQIDTGETGIDVYTDENGVYQYKMETRSRFSEKTRWNSEVVDFLGEMQSKIRVYGSSNPHCLAAPSMKIWTCHRRKGQVFRGHPNFRGKGPWRDWVMVNWGQGWGKMPCNIWCFVELDALPKGSASISHGGIYLKDGVFAVVETATLDDQIKSDLLMPVLKEVELDADGDVTGRRFYLADTEAFEDPICVVPDIGGPKNRYFVVKARNQWARCFVQWLQDPHNLDEMDPILPPKEESGSDSDSDAKNKPRKKITRRKNQQKKRKRRK